MLTDAALLTCGLYLDYATLGWTVVRVIIVGLTALAAHSLALAGLGLESLIDIVASVIVVWHLTGINQQRERQALRLINGSPSPRPTSAYISVSRDATPACTGSGEAVVPRCSALPS